MGLRRASRLILLDSQRRVLLLLHAGTNGESFWSPPGGGLETGETFEQAARREAMEETGIAPEILAEAKTIAIFPRLYDRPRDIRIAWNNLPGTEIMPGDIMMIPTQGVCIHVPGDFREIRLEAGDDAGGVRVVKLAGLDAAGIGILDHYTMLRQAAALSLA